MKLRHQCNEKPQASAHIQHSSVSIQNDEYSSLTLVLAALLPAVLASPTPVSQQFKSEVIPGKYIITLKEDVAVRDVSSHLNWVSDVHRRSLNECTTVGIENTYNIRTWNAYAGEFNDETIQRFKDNTGGRICFLLRVNFYTQDS
ncbi:putative Subtilase [Seiridium cardinale]